MHNDRIGATMMNIVVQLQHGGSCLGLVWDPGITLFNNSTNIRDDSASFDSP
jgi:hypothetical protein